MKRKRLSLIRRMSMPLPELQSYYREQRKREFLENSPMSRQIDFRKRTRPLFLGLLSVYLKIIGVKLTQMGKPCAVDDAPCIYACTHNYRLDFEMCFSTIRKSCWLFMGDPNETYKNLDGFLLWLNGAILADTDYREDCHIGKETAIRLLQQGGSLLIYPEGAWNLSENLPVQKMYEGAAEMALRTGAKIIPMAMEQYGKRYVVNTGKPLDPAAYSGYQESQHGASMKDGKRRMTCDLRDELASLRWEIWENEPTIQRDKLPRDASESFHRMIMEQSENGYTEEEIERTRFHERNEEAHKEAEGCLDRLIPKRENAFLLREAYKRGIIRLPKHISQ